jgi:peptidoglycan/xylan/chitin deacetylase (PgdA/CDA1 family)
MFHGVSSARRAEYPSDIQPYLDARDLRAVLHSLGKRFRFLTPEEFFGSGKPGMLLTFDDGLANNATVAMPVLEKHDAPAVFFVTTRHSADPADWLPHIRTIAARRWSDISAVPADIAADWYDGMSAEQLAALARYPLATVA